MFQAVFTFSQEIHCIPKHILHLRTMCSTA